MSAIRSGVASLSIILGASAGCRSDASSNTSRAAGDGGSSTTTDRSVTWFKGAAPLLLAPDRTPDRSLIALADTALAEPEGALLDSNATFVRLDGTTAKGRVAITQSAEGCTEAAIDPAPPDAWGVGFIGGMPTALRADSMRAMTPQDSSALTRSVTRLASIVPNGPGSRFGGLPFVVVDLWRMKLPDGKTALVASLRRQINQEDSPLQERTFVVAESDSTETDGYALVHSERSSGAEETVESRELLAAVLFPPSQSVELVVAHDFGDETSYGIVERSAPLKWETRWMSRRFSC
jgi:hypothetical protein